MQFKKNILLFLTAAFIGGCKCDSYFSNSSEKYLEERYFNIECHVVPTVVQTESDKIEITLNYKQMPSQKVVRSTLKILPVVFETGDTLKLLSEYASVYTFNSKKELKSKLNLVLKFDVDSAGVIVSKNLFFEKLKKVRKCRFRPVLH